MTTETPETTQYSVELVQQAKEAGFQVETYAKWVAAAQQEGITIAEYIDGLDEAEVDDARTEESDDDGGEEG